MRNLLFAAATAAALTLAAGAANAQPANWNGFYVGVVAGYADRSESSNETIVFDTNLDGNYGDTVKTAAGVDAFSPGFCGGSFKTNAAAGGCNKDDDTDVEIGVRAGYDHQFGDWVVGGVVEYSQLQFSDGVTAFSTTPAAYNFTRKLRDLFALRARGGYAFGDNLIYATGGYAEGNVHHTFRTTNTVNAFTPSAGGGSDATGYQLGVGFEHKFTPNISLGGEFIHTNLDDDKFGVRAVSIGTTPPTNPFLLVNPQGTGFLRSSDKIKFNSYRLTASYRF